MEVVMVICGLVSCFILGGMVGHEIRDKKIVSLKGENRELKAEIAAKAAQKIRAGSTVYHRRTQENWFILGVNERKNKVCVAGWPPSQADLSDCILIDIGKGLTEQELEYRNREFGTDWD